ncbi:uncharacterized protein LOC112514250 [Cynara cardunculus var. scolymus]|uniref:Uncharacterized protein n=1 Tax=Cynara cardunculus var. scolymus TaxID=59895 RepID=A0A103XXT5_CYNCS|nr:uncharacterized protein LOC112514250 [Cynara cardunculus var. scolymus]KVH98918.1 hypothetical protein Ccrd_022814 [Cynara cardunculus var. scolymus]
MITRPTTTGTTVSCLFFMVSSFYILMFHNDHGGLRWSSCYVYYVLVVGVVVVAGLAVVMARATMVTLITVLVMLACAGKHRRVLVVEGRQISGEVVMYLLRVMKERSLVAVAGVAFVTSMAMVWTS